MIIGRFDLFLKISEKFCFLFGDIGNVPDI